MRLWTINPKYLDSKGLVALWREGLLAQACLSGKAIGYSKHAQLERFYKSSKPVFTIGYYLYYILQHANIDRGFGFNPYKIINFDQITAHNDSIKEYPKLITANYGQLMYERELLLDKLHNRGQWQAYNRLVVHTEPDSHPLIEILPSLEPNTWERVK